MKTYVKTIEAIQFTGEISQALPFIEFIGPDSTLVHDEGKFTLSTPTQKWNVSKGDYIVKEYNGLVVFKEPRFLKDYALQSKPDTKEEKFIPKVHSIDKIQEVEQPKIENPTKEDKSFMDKVKAGTHITTEELQDNKDIASTKPKTDKPEEK